jgi:hypothetical protein
MTQMKLDTLTLRYWQNFELAEGELEYLSELLIEEESPLTVEELARRLMDKRTREEASAWEQREAKGLIYQPRDSYREGDRLVFPALGDAVGTVVGIRSGRNPEYGPFDVIQVELEGRQAVKEFASSLSQTHALNIITIEEDHDFDLADTGALGQKLFARYGHYVTPALLAAMTADPDFVDFGGQWFLRGFLLPIEEGHLNLAEAVLDLAGGFGAVDDILPVLEVPKEASRAVQVFSLNHALATDRQGRFEFAGTEGRSEWCLPGVANTRPLRFAKAPSDITQDHVLDEVVQLVGEAAGADDMSAKIDHWSHVLTFYDWYWGHLPYTKEASQLLVQPLFEEQRCTRLQFRFGGSGDMFPVILHYPNRRRLGWLGSSELRKFFEEKELVPGTAVVIESTPTSESDGLYTINYHPAPAAKLEMLDYEETGQPAFRRMNVRCEVDDEMSLRRSRFSALETLRLLDATERGATQLLLAAAFQRVGEKLLKGLGIVYRADFPDLFVATNIERPFPRTILAAVFAQGPYPCFYRDEEGLYIYNPSRTSEEVNKVTLTWDEALLDAGSSAV